MSIINAKSSLDTKIQQFFCRFQRLRGIIPNSDQKRDKASFLLEVPKFLIIVMIYSSPIYNIFKTFNK